MGTFKRRIRMFGRNLTVRWVLVSCIAVLPVNILAVVITNTVTKSYERNIIESYSSQLSIYARSVDAELEHMKGRVMDFLDDANMYVLTKGSQTDSTVQVTRFREQIGDSTSWMGIPGISYIWDHSKDIISLFPQKKSYSFEQKQVLEQVLRQDEEIQGIHTRKEYIRTEDTAFSAKHYSFQHFTFGLMIDIEETLKGFYDSCGDIRGRLYLADSDGCLMSGLSEEGFWPDFGQENMEELLGDEHLVVLEQEVDSGNYRIVQVIEKSELMKTLPVLVNVLYFLACSSFLVIPILCVFAARLVINPLKELCGAMEEVEEGNLQYQLQGKNSTFQMDYLYSRFNHMVEELHTLVTESYEREIEKLQTDSINMRLQVNQHMLLNFLNTIYSLARVNKSEQVSEFALLLMKYFRYVLRQDISLVTVGEEMEFVRDYLRIQKIRFPDSFTSVYSVAEEAEEILIPQLLIENFVENTIKYGLIMGSEVEILINIRVEENRLLISICDTGNGIPKDIVDKLNRGEVVEDRIGKHIGIWNCRRRLRYYYGDAYELKITSGLGEGTQVWVDMPIKPLEREDAIRKVRQMGDQNEHIDCGR